MLRRSNRHGEARDRLTAALAVLRPDPDADTVAALDHLAAVEIFSGGPDAERLSTEALVLGQALDVDAGLLADLFTNRGIAVGFASRVADLLSELFGLEADFLRPGLPLVVLGQFSYIAAIATLTISARLKRFDRTLEEAALNLGASHAAVLRTITLPYLRPALIGSAAIAFLMSFENFNTTLMLVGADSPLTIMMYGRMREGATPVLNAVSLFLMLASAALALTLLRSGKPARAPAP